ncbi:hypothetical protein GCM10027046_27020 [Uliginosibacterium flavum]
MALPALAGPVIETRFSEQCALNSNEPALRVFDDAASWHAFRAETPLPAFSRRLDWRRQRVLVFTVGIRPTPGYSLTLKASRLRRSDQTLLLDVAEQGPPADAFLPQMLTQPCLAIVLRKAAWRHVQVSDVDSGRGLLIGPESGI